MTPLLQIKAHKVISPARLATALVAGLLTLFFQVSSSEAMVLNTSGSVVDIAPPPMSVEVSEFESDTTISVFEESQQLALPSDLEVDVTEAGSYGPDSKTPGTVPAGTIVDSFFLHADQVSSSGTLTLSGSVTFADPIVGVIVSHDLLDSADTVVGVSTTSYPTGVSARGLEASTDRVEIDGRTVTVTFAIQQTVDQIRVLTSPRPIPAMTFSIDYQGPPLVAAYPAGHVISEGNF